MKIKTLAAKIGCNPGTISRAKKRLGIAGPLTDATVRLLIEGVSAGRGSGGHWTAGKRRSALRASVISPITTRLRSTLSVGALGGGLPSIVSARSAALYVGVDARTVRRWAVGDDMPMEAVDVEVLDEWLDDPAAAILVMVGQEGRRGVSAAARECDVSVSAVTRWVSGIAQPSERQLRLCLRALYG